MCLLSEAWQDSAEHKVPKGVLASDMCTGVKVDGADLGEVVITLVNSPTMSTTSGRMRRLPRGERILSRLLSQRGRARVRISSVVSRSALGVRGTPPGHAVLTWGSRRGRGEGERVFRRSG